MTTPLIASVLDELSGLINDSDLHISQLVLTLLCTIMTVSPASIAGIHSQILPRILDLVVSSLLQGSALVACLQFFSQLVKLEVPGMEFGAIFEVYKVITKSLRTLCTDKLSFWIPYTIATSICTHSHKVVLYTIRNFVTCFCFCIQMLTSFVYNPTANTIHKQV